MKSNLTTQFRHELISYNRVLVVTHTDTERTLRLEGYRLSSLGSQVMKLGAFTPHDGYFRNVGRDIKQQGFEVLYARFKRVTETEGSWSDEEKL